VFGQFFEHGLLAFGAVPAAQEIGQAAELGLQAFRMSSLSRTR
jgi:hypothetical protein